MRYLPFFLFLLFPPPVLAEPVTLTAADWARPRAGEAVTAQPVLTRIVDVFERQSAGAIIVIAHGTGENDQLWAEELRSWFVALGIASSYVQLELRPGVQEELMLDVHPRAYP